MTKTRGIKSISIFLVLVLILSVLTMVSCKKSEDRTSNYAPNTMTQAESQMQNISVRYGTEGYAEKVGEYNTEEYNRIYENRFLDALSSPLSTFSIDVDTASYSNIRRFITDGQLPPVDAVRIEEMINYFSYQYPQPKRNDPFSITTEIGKCPWNEENLLVMVGLQGRELDTKDAPPSNIVFLIDVSGSMNSPDKLPLLKSAFKLLVDELDEKDRVSIVVYAGAAGMVLEPTSGDNKQKIMDALNQLEAGGSTAGGEGIQLAYKAAKQSFIKGGNNRVILATDGDFNVGISSEGELTRLIEKKREEGVFLTVLSFGKGNLKDSKMEQLADKGNGSYAYIDSIMEAKKVLVNEISSTLYTIAKDVKLQVEFNPAKVKSYRLIGYENRRLNNEDFDDDTKDAGEMGAGHTVTALYEIVPADNSEKPDTSGLKYQDVTLTNSSDWMSVRFRYKDPDGSESKLISDNIINGDLLLKQSDNFLFASAVGEFGMLLRGSEYKGKSSYDQLIERAKAAKGKDEEGYRSEFIRLAETAKLLSR